jgi:asparagine synthase (glutamine-hydrolysing)
MCGIAGIILKQPNNSQLHSQMEMMLGRIAHRGPDSQGLFEARPDFIMGHRRLAILDLSPDGHQPMHASDKQCTIIFNGEIYNYIEIKQQLIQKGYKFFTSTDTEVILNAYLCWGKDCVKYFNGMWAFAIYDKTNNVVFCSRDRFGVKPFYFTNNENHFIFCSEIKGITPFLNSQTAHLELVIDYLITQKTDHTHETFFKEIIKLPAGHHLTYNLNNHEYNIHRYYQLEALDNLPNEIDYLNTLKDAIKIRLRSDVPVGTCLSGGLDSSTVASIASKHFEPGNFQAITAISEQKSNDESNFAKQVVEFCQLNWITTKPDFHDFSSHIENIMWTQEEPFSSPSIVMQYFVMQTAKNSNIPVLLDGQGGDETLLGYERYNVSQLYSIFLQNGPFAFLNALNQAKKHNEKLTWINLAKFLFGSHMPMARYHVHRLQHTYLKQRPHIPNHLSDYAKALKNLFNLQKLELESTNLPALLRFEDKNSMAHSIETRLPFLDYRAVEIALALPFEKKIQQGWSKYLIRQAMQQQLPKNILWRKNKFGFEAPENFWLNQFKQSMKHSVEHSNLISEITKNNKLHQQFYKLPLRTQWRLYTLALWEKTYNINEIK